MKEPNQEPKKENRGGARKGAGRPKGRNNYRSIALRIPQDVAEILENVEGSRSAYIIEAIRRFDKEQRKRTILGIEISYTKS